HGPRCNSRYIRTCCGMAAAMPWPTRATTHGRYRPGSVTRTSSTPSATPSWHRIGSRISGVDAAGRDFAEREIMEYWHGVRGSVRLRTREFHHLCPLLGFVSDELAEFGGRHRHRHAAQVAEPRLDRGVGEAGVNCLVERVDDLGGCILRNADAIP